MSKLKVDWAHFFKKNLSANFRPTETYNIPNQWKFDEDFTELYRFKIAGLIEGDISVCISPLFNTCQSNMGCAYKFVSVK